MAGFWASKLDIRMTGRPVAFSGKKKKAQLKARKLRKAAEDTDEEEIVEQKPIVQQEHTTAPTLTSSWNLREPKYKTSAAQNAKYSTPMVVRNTTDSKLREIDVEKFYEQTSVDIPVRPSWTYEMSKEDLEASEVKYFELWLDSVYKTIKSENLGFFEQNLEVWRQFWRVCEMSDVIVVVVDARFPVLHYPLSLHKYIKEQLGKPFILVLMKCDLVPEHIVVDWENALRQVFPSLTIRRASSLYMAKTEDHKALCSVRRQLIIDELRNQIHPHTQSQKLATVGLLGQPNVGKSSLINMLVGRNVVSASKTPGHTKHFQTIKLDDYIQLCDCPGLVLPVSLPRELQILNGLYNVAQLKDPYGALMVAHELTDLTKSLKVDKDPQTQVDLSIIGICERIAEMEGFFTSGAGRPDTYRAANFILRSIVSGSKNLCIFWYPKLSG